MIEGLFYQVVLGPLRQLTALTDATNITALILLGAMDHVKYTLQRCKRQLKSPIIAIGVRNAVSEVDWTVGIVNGCMNW